MEETIVRFNFLENNVFKLAWLYVNLTMVFSSSNAELREVS